MKLSINDIVINPEYTEQNPSDFLAGFFKEQEKTAKIVCIIERDWTTEEKGYTKRVETSDHPDAYVLLEGKSGKYRLSELTKA
jgi:hypothetical protein